MAMENSLKTQALEVIRREVKNLFATMFSIDVEVCDNCYENLDDDTIVAKCSLFQDDVIFVLRFAFQRHVISPMIVKLYDPIMAMHESTIEDAACEISNIVCSGLKTFLNQSGYKLRISLPEIDPGFKSYSDRNPESIGIYFIVQGNIFQIGIEESACNIKSRSN